MSSFNNSSTVNSANQNCRVAFPKRDSGARVYEAFQLNKRTITIFMKVDTAQSLQHVLSLESNSHRDNLLSINEGCDETTACKKQKSRVPPSSNHTARYYHRTKEMPKGKLLCFQDTAALKGVLVKKDIDKRSALSLSSKNLAIPPCNFFHNG